MKTRLQEERNEAFLHRKRSRLPYKAANAEALEVLLPQSLLIFPRNLINCYQDRSRMRITFNPLPKKMGERRSEDEKANHMFYFGFIFRRLRNT